MDESHGAFAESLRQRVLDAGVLDARLRMALLAGAPVEAPYADLARCIADESYRVTDEQVTAVQEAAGSERAAFEVVLATSIGAGLRRWDAAVRAIGEVTDATA